MIDYETPANNICLLCLEEKDTYNRSVITNQNQRFYMGFIYQYKFNCPCNIQIHRSCMRKWMSKSVKCPICLSELQNCNTICRPSIIHTARYLLFYSAYMCIIHCICAFSLIFTIILYCREEYKT